MGARPRKLRSRARELWWVVEELGPAACSLCVWACERASLTELLPLGGGITALPLLGCRGDGVSGAVSACMRCWAHSARYKWELKAIALCLGGERGMWSQCLPCPALLKTPCPLSSPCRRGSWSAAGRQPDGALKGQVPSTCHSFPCSVCRVLGAGARPHFLLSIPITPSFNLRGPLWDARGRQSWF